MIKIISSKEYRALCSQLKDALDRIESGTAHNKALSKRIDVLLKNAYDLQRTVEEGDTKIASLTLEATNARANEATAVRRAQEALTELSAAREAAAIHKEIADDFRSRMKTKGRPKAKGKAVKKARTK